MLENQVHILDNRLEQAVEKVDKNPLENRESRQGIDDLRGERMAFECVEKNSKSMLRNEVDLCL